MPFVYLALWFDMLRSFDEYERGKTLEVDILASHSVMVYFWLIILRFKKITPTEIKIQSSYDLPLLPECLLLLPKLKRLDLQEANLNSQTLKRLMQIMPDHFSSLKTLRLPYHSGVAINTADLNPFLQQSQIEELSIAALQFRDLKPHFGHLKKLHLSHLSAQDCLGLGEIEGLINLAITDSVIPENCFNQLKLRNLVALNLTRSRILQADFGRSFLSVLLTCRIENLNLSEAEVHPFLLVLLLEFFKNDEHLQVLNLAKVIFNATIWRDLFFNLSFHSSLKTLDVSEAGLGDKPQCFLALEYFIKENRSIQHLNLSDNQFPAEIGLHLLKQVFKFSKVSTLEFRNQFGEGTSLDKASVHALSRNSDLEYLDLCYAGQLSARLERKIQTVLAHNQSLHHVVGINSLELISRNIYFHQVLKLKLETAIRKHDFNSIIRVYEDLKVFIANFALEKGVMVDYLRRFYLDVLLNECHIENPGFILALVETNPRAPELIELMVLNLFAQTCLDKSYLYPFLYHIMLQLPDEKINARQFWIITQYLQGHAILGFEDRPISVSMHRQHRIDIDFVSAKKALMRALLALDVGDKPNIENKPQQLQLCLVKVPSQLSLYKAKLAIGSLLLGLVSLFGFYWIKVAPKYSSLTPGLA